MSNSQRAVELEIRLATQKFLASLTELESRYDGTMQSVEGDSKAAAAGMEQAFKVLGLKGVQAVEQEVAKLQAALAQIRQSPDVLPADKAAAVAAFNQRLAALRAEAQQTPPALGGIGSAASQASQSLADAAHKAVAWTAALTGISSASDVVGQLVSTGSEFENLRVRLENLLGSTEAATTAFDMIKKLAATTPFEVKALTESFVKLTAMGMQPTEAQMRSLSDVAANLGGGTETLAGVTLALGQAWAKGKLQGEEIMQLAERGVPVWDALARATGRSVPELQRMSEAGTLGRDVIGKLIDELGRMNAGASDKLMNTYAGSVSNAKDALAEFYDMVSRSGVLEFLTGKLKEVLAEFERMKNTGELQAKARALSDTFITVAQAVEMTVKALVTFAPQIKLAAEAALAMKAANMAGTLLAIASGAAGAGAGMAAAGAASATAATQMEVATAAGGRMATMLRLLRTLSGVGLVLGVAELAQEFLRAKRAAEEGDAAVRKALEEKPTNGPKKAAEAATQALDATVSKADDLVKEFDTLIEKGDQADEALGKIGKKFDLASAPGIRDAATVLDALLAKGKITATQFQEEWEKALKGVNLLEFEARARQAMEATAASATLLQQALDAGLREAIRRAGADFEVLSGGMGKAAKSAVGDVDTIIGGLDRLKAQGVDVAQALIASIGKGINTADSQAAIEAVRTRIEAVRNVLGDKITDGLLDQAKAKANELTDAMDKATPGINSVREAMKALGITSDETLRATAEKAREAYQTLRDSGTASAREVEAAFRKAAQEAIAANDGIAPAWVQTEATMRGLEAAVDRTGRAIIRAMGDGAESARGLGGAFRQTTEQIREQQDAMDRIEMRYKLSADYTERQIALLEREAAAIEKAAAAELKRLNIDKEKYSLDASGKRIEQLVQTRDSVASTLQGKGVDAATAAGLAARLVDAVGNLNLMSSGVYQDGDTLSVVLEKMAKRYGGASAAPGASSPTAAAQTHTVNLTINGRNTPVNVASAADATALVAALRGAASNAGLL